MPDYPRFNQLDHGFTQLTAVVVATGGWRRARAGERFHLIVARVYGKDTFAGVQIGEIDGLSGIQKGAFYGVNGSGDLQLGVSPVVAVGAGDGTVVVIGDGDISTTVNTALFERLTNKGVPGGYVPLGADGLIASAYIPPSTNTEPIQRSWMNI